MASILEALEMAQQRNKQRDVMNTQRQMPVLPIIPTGQVQPVQLNVGGNGGDGPVIDTRTPHQQYLDAIDTNQYVGAIPVVGPALGVLNDSFIENYEKENPDKVVGGGLSKYSTIGRMQGRGLTVEEQLEAEKAGLGFGKALGFGEKNEAGVAPAGYTMFDRIFGRTPMNIGNEADYIGSFPESQISNDGGSEGGPIGGYEQEDLSYDSFAGSVGYA